MSSYERTDTLPNLGPDRCVTPTGDCATPAVCNAADRCQAATDTLPSDEAREAAERMSGYACNGGPDDCALRRAWGAYDADRWIRSLPAGVFPGTMYQEPTPKPTERCEACPNRAGGCPYPKEKTMTADALTLPSDEAVEAAAEWLGGDGGWAHSVLEAAYAIDMPRREAEVRADQTRQIVEWLRQANTYLPLMNIEIEAVHRVTEFLAAHFNPEAER